MMRTVRAGYSCARQLLTEKASAASRTAVDNTMLGISGADPRMVVRPVIFTFLLTFADARLAKSSVRV
jgi:hypothetical protein